MALTILPRPEQQPTALETLSGNFSSGLQALLNTKMQGMQQQQMGRGLQALGIPGQLAMLPPELLQHIVPQYMKTQAEMPISNLRQQIVGGQGSDQAATGTQQGSPSMGAYDDNGNITVPEINRRRQLINQLSKTPGGYKAAESEEKTLNDLIKNRQEFMKGERELSLKERELGIKHGERAEERLTKKQQQEEMKAIKENAVPNKVNADLAIKAKPIISTIDTIIDLMQSGNVATGTAVNATPEGLLKTLYGEDTLTAHKELKKLVEALGKSDVKGMMSKSRQQLLEAAKASLYQDPEEIVKLLNQYREEFYPYIRKQEIADEIILDNDKIQPRGLWPMVNRQFNEEQAITDVIKSLEDQGISIDSIPQGTTKKAPKSNVVVMRDTKAPLGFTIRRNKNG